MKGVDIYTNEETSDFQFVLNCKGVENLYIFHIFWNGENFSKISKTESVANIVNLIL